MYLYTYNYNVCVCVYVVYPWSGIRHGFLSHKLLPLVASATILRRYHSESCCCCCYLYNIHIYDIYVLWYFIPGKQFFHSFIPDCHCIFLNAVFMPHLHQSYFLFFIFFLRRPSTSISTLCIIIITRVQEQ